MPDTNNINVGVIRRLASEETDLAANEDHIGSVGGQALAPGLVELVRPSDTTAYAVGDALGTNLAISAATNATPIVITTPAHGLIDGDPITISGAGGNTAANGNFFAKRVSPTTAALYSDDALVLPVAGNGAWTSGGVVARALRFRNALRLTGGSAFLTKLLLACDNAANVAQVRLHLFRSNPTAPLDNSVWSVLYTEFGIHLGWIDLPALYSPASPQTGGAALSEFLGQLELVGVVKDLYAIPQIMTVITPVSGSKFAFIPTFDVN